MAHFKRGNLQLKTNQQIQLGDSQESLIKYDGSDLLVNPSSGALKLYNNGSEVAQTIATGLQAGVAAFDIKTSGGEDGITINNNGAVEVFYNNVKQFETISTGIQTGVAAFDIKTSGGNDGIRIYDGSNVLLYFNGNPVVSTSSTGLQAAVAAFDIETSGGEDGITINNNGSVEIFHNNIKSFETNVAGINVSDNSGNDPTIYFNNSSDATVGQIMCNNGAFSLYDDVNNKYFLTTLVNQGVSLYFNGVRTLETQTEEIRLWNSAGSAWFEQRISGSDVFLQNRSLGGAIQIWARDGGSVNRGMITMSPNNSVELFYQGVRQVKTIATGIQASDTITAFDIKTSGGEDGITINNNGSVELFYDNSLKLATDATGVTVIGNLTTNDLTVDGNTIYLGGTTLTEAAGGGLKVDGDLEVTGSLNLPEGSVEASDVDYAKVAGATYSTVQEGMDQLGSAGVISGGVISEDSTAQISITAGTGLIRTSNSDHSPLVFIDWSGTSIHLPEDESKTIVVKYNAGSPAVFAEDPVNVNLNNMIVLGQVETVDGHLFFSTVRQRAGNFNAKLLNRMYDDNPVARANNAGLILGESADSNRYVTMTGGDVWSLLDIDTIDAINTGTGDEFVEYWDDGAGGWNYSAGETQWNMTQYDNLSGTLATLGADRYTCRWFYLVPPDNSLHMMFGISNTKNLAEAYAEPAPTDIPFILREHSILLGRLIIQKDVAIATDVQTAFETTFNFTGTTNHANLANLEAPADDHTQYSLVTGARDFTGTVGGIDPVSSTDFVTLGYMSRLGTEEQRIFYPETGLDSTEVLRIDLDVITGLHYVDFETDHAALPWKEGRVYWDQENHTFAVYNDVPEVTLQVGQESHLRVRNISGQMIPNGSPVYITGADEGLPTVDLAKSDNINTVNAVTIATHDIDNTSNGYTTVTGVVNDVDTSGFNPGDTLYVSDSTAGVITNIRPKSPNIAHRVGVATDIGVSGRMVSDSHPAADQMQVLTYTLPLKDVVDDEVPLTGTFDVIAAAQTTDITTPFAVRNQHLYIYVNSLTGSGTVTITGGRVSERTAITDSTASETITIDQAGVYYQTSFKWWDVYDITFAAGISAINFDYGAVGYPDMGNRNFSIIGYRCDAYSQKDTADFSIIINKVQDDGNKKMSIVQLEDFGVDSQGTGIVDNLRTGAYDRSYLPQVATVWPNNAVLTLKQLDFNTYFTSSENDILSKDNDEGFFIRIEGEGGGISEVDYITMYLYYELLP